MRELSEFTADMAIHQKLDDEPNDVGGLSAAELKKKFDEPGLAIQGYLNETLVPQVREALEDALGEAKSYTDQKVVAVGAGDMAAAVYDPAGQREDVFAFARKAAREAVGDAARFGYVAAGSSNSMANWESPEATVSLGEHLDLRGLWNSEELAFVAPAGAKGMLFTLQVRWAKQSFMTAAVEAQINGQVVASAQGPNTSDGTYVCETVLLPVAVTGGDAVRLVLRVGGSSGKAEVNVKYIRAEVIL